MKLSKFRITFITDIEVIIHAGSQPQAEILAQADQIRKGNNYEIKEVLEVIED